MSCYLQNFDYKGTFITYHFYWFNKCINQKLIFMDLHSGVSVAYVCISLLGQLLLFVPHWKFDQGPGLIEYATTDSAVLSRFVCVKFNTRTCNCAISRDSIVQMFQCIYNTHCPLIHCRNAYSHGTKSMECSPMWNTPLDLQVKTTMYWYIRWYIYLLRSYCLAHTTYIYRKLFLHSITLLLSGIDLVWEGGFPVELHGSVV